MWKTPRRNKSASGVRRSAMVPPRGNEQLNVTPEHGASLQLPLYCLRQGQIEGQKWIADHPTWRIEKWSCHPHGKVRFKV
jgi:hypothetical protein